MRYKAVQINLTQLSKEVTTSQRKGYLILMLYQSTVCQTLLQRRVGFALGWQKRGRF